jgi:hypothetical protein
MGLWNSSVSSTLSNFYNFKLARFVEKVFFYSVCSDTFKFSYNPRKYQNFQVSRNVSNSYYKKGAKNWNLNNSNRHETNEDVNKREGVLPTSPCFQDVTYEDVRNIGKIVRGCIIRGSNVRGRIIRECNIRGSTILVLWYLVMKHVLSEKADNW